MSRSRIPQGQTFPRTMTKNHGISVTGKRLIDNAMRNEKLDKNCTLFELTTALEKHYQNHYLDRFNINSIHTIQEYLTELEGSGK